VVNGLLSLEKRLLEDERDEVLPGDDYHLTLVVPPGFSPQPMPAAPPPPLPPVAPKPPIGDLRPKVLTPGPAGLEYSSSPVPFDAQWPPEMQFRWQFGPPCPSTA
jgi:hypothetical protein